MSIFQILQYNQLKPVDCRYLCYGVTCKNHINFIKIWMQLQHYYIFFFFGLTFFVYMENMHRFQLTIEDIYYTNKNKVLKTFHETSSYF